ncbi:MAG: PAS domain-containing protein [Rhodospirillaceae bacterium]|nr:PAS domain-containing protein [Rhodospirillales bacterium]
MSGLGGNARGKLARLTAVYKGLLELAFVLLPLALVAYLHQFQSPPLKFHDHLFHEIAIGVSIILSLFAAWVAFRCYAANGEPSLRYITLAFLGFALVYAPHGVLTRVSDHNLWLFILFGPASRVVMAGFLLEALMRHGEAPDSVSHRTALSTWMPWVAAMALVDVAVAVLAHSPLAGAPANRWVMEGLAILLCLAGVVTIRRRRLRSGLMWIYQVALLSFATSSAGFLLTTAWTHLWWLSHAIFAGGFFTLSHGLVRSYLTTRSVANVYSEQEMLARLAGAEAAAEAARAAEAKLMELFDSSPVGILVADPQGRVLFCNRRQAALLGLDPAAALGRNERAFYSAPEIRDRSVALALATGKPVSAEMDSVSADGAMQCCMVTWTPAAFADRPALVAWNVDVTDRRRAALAMEQAKRAAEEANRAKTEFLAAMSHELRTPLNAINGFAETMQAEILGPLGNDRYREYCGHIVESGHHLTELINDVLDVAKVESGRVSLREESVSVQRLVMAALTMVRDRASRAELVLDAQLAPDLPDLLGDELRLKQVLLNLLGNAVKFTPAGGRVAIRAWVEDNGGIAMVVDDTGIGIAAHDKDKALAPFSQVDTRLERRYEGLGLGLPLSRNLMELHGGTLELDSVPGKGTRVTLRFPPQRSAIRPPCEAVQSGTA